MNKMHSVIVSSFLILVSIGGSGQVGVPAEEKAVKEVIEKVFVSMAKGDSAALHSIFSSGATMVSVYRDKNNEPVLKRDPSIDPFLKAIGTPHPEPYHEEVWNLKISKTEISRKPGVTMRFMSATNLVIVASTHFTYTKTSMDGKFFT